ncbi:MAG: hypothetical protein U9Q90_05890 [Campylobacterota bacterium]|nr:hypothetical protein [Campylobacterota bacterium]
MVKPFYLASSLLLLIIISMGVHYALGDRLGVTDSINAVGEMTRICSPSFSVAYYEPRMQGVKKADNIAYPEMMPIDRMDFVYAK